MTHQLRRGGYLLEWIAPLEPTLRDWQARLSTRGHGMLTDAAELDAYLRTCA
ncbi:hypothetical protein [Nonomuraea sp. CA-141351]|uniref:hypothetical protein n=1 Tax=Nonomuraea sp. CA-141351 TaxID=3239996 RepID=UPI003D8D6D1C